jgi:hypothetical protein
MSGQIGYEAYRAHTGGVSLATGQSLPEWQHLKPEIQAAWDAAGTALRADLEVAQKRIAKLEAERDSLAAVVATAESDRASLYKICRDAIRALGGVAEYGVSIDFLANLPTEITAQIAKLTTERDSLAAALEVAKQDAFETWRHDQGADDSLEAYEYFLREAEYPLADAFFGPHASVLAARDRHVREQVIDALLEQFPETPIGDNFSLFRSMERKRFRAALRAAKEAKEKKDE